MNSNADQTSKQSAEQTMKQDYEALHARREKFRQRTLSGCFENQEKRYVPPFRIYGNLYYVGDSWVCVHILDTGNGLLMFDAGNCANTAMLIHSIWKMGFNPEDVKWIVLSHGHLDHTGGAEFFRNMFGSKIYLSDADAKMFREHPELALMQDSPNLMDDVFEPDVEIHEGDIIDFGGTKVRFTMVPGHTKGCIACFFDAVEDGVPVRVGYYGGFGFNTLQKEYLEEIGDMDYRMRQIYLDSLHKVMDEKVDLFMGNHEVNVGLLRKREQMLEDPSVNPFLDGNAWKAYLKKKEEDLKNQFGL